MSRPRAHGDPLISGRYRARAEDFRVEEVLGFAASGDGPHRFLYLEKRGQNTEWVARQLARVAGVRPRDIGFCGLKDRHAVTRQWFSVPVDEGAQASFSEASIEAAMDGAIEGVTVVEATSNRRKLRRGAHAANRFVLRLSDCRSHRDADALDAALVEDLDARLRRIAEAGVPNYFGPQRYGHDGGNLASAREALLAARPGRRPPAWHLSVMRAWLFDRVLAERVRRGDWDRPLPGERLMLDGSHSHFLAQAPDAALMERVHDMDVHPTGPMPGRGGDDDAPQDEAAVVEASALTGEDAMLEALAVAGVDAARRALRTPVRGLRWSIGSDSLELAFELPPGAYATSVLDEIGAFEDAAARASSENE